MFPGFESSKKQGKNKREPVVESLGDSAGPQSRHKGKGAFSTGQDPREMGGVTIQEFSRENRVPEPEAWRMLRRGELVGRTFQGRLYVFTNVTDSVSADAGDELTSRIDKLLDEETEPVETREANLSAHELSTPEHSLTEHTASEQPSSFRTALPPLPEKGDNTPRAGAAAGDIVPVPAERITSTEIALLLDHLSLAKEENREILKMTQESIRKVTELTDTIVEMKDTVIEARESQIHFLKDQLESKDREIRKLLQQKEDLEILAQTIMTTQQRER